MKKNCERLVSWPHLGSYSKKQVLTLLYSCRRGRKEEEQQQQQQQQQQQGSLDFTTYPMILNVNRRQLEKNNEMLVSWSHPESYSEELIIIWS